MITGKGRIACQGAACGKIFEIKSKIKPQSAADEYLSPEEELVLFEEGVKKSLEQLAALGNKAREELGEEEALIFEMQAMMLEDPDIKDAIAETIKKGAISAAKACLIVGEEQARAFEALDDPYMKERALDVRDVTERTARAISGASNAILTEPCIVVADDLTPSQTMAFKRELILGMILRHGAMNSHAAILARTMNIPTLIGAELPPSGELDGRMAALDAVHGIYYADPTPEVITKVQEEKDRFTVKRLRLLGLRGKPSVAPCGHVIKTFANIGRPDDVEMVLENDAEGVGLFRSEFLFLERDGFPSEEEQYKAYAKAAQSLNGRLTVIRTLDIGADKQAHYFNLPKEENPALGMRAIRICLTRPEIFKTQLRAIYRAAYSGNVAMMFPMITRAEEVDECLKICAEVEEALKTEGVPFKVPQIGIMIETPAAVLLASELAKKVDFFSVGTNDLLQYTAALDRQNQNLGRFYDPHHPALLKSLEIIARAAHEAGIWCGICGELAGDLSLTDKFIELGFDELSVTPGLILELREKIRSSKAQCLNPNLKQTQKC